MYLLFVERTEPTRLKEFEDKVSKGIIFWVTVRIHYSRNGKDA